MKTKNRSAVRSGPPHAEIPCHREQGKIGPADELREGKLLLLFLFLVEDLDRKAVEHQDQHIDRMRSGEGKDQACGNSGKYEKYCNSPRGDTKPAGIGRVPKIRQYFVSLSDSTSFLSNTRSM